MGYRERRLRHRNAVQRPNVNARGTPTRLCSFLTTAGGNWRANDWGNGVERGHELMPAACSITGSDQSGVSASTGRRM